MPLHRIRRIQDSVHGLMEFHGLESRVIDLLSTPELQRLRRVRQLGLAHLVFPAAEHSRLSHSIGAAFVATRFARELQHRTREIFIDEIAVDDAATRDIAIAALCHDLGHGPLSHAWEREVVGEHFDRRAWCNSLGLPELAAISELKWHELVGHAILAWPEGRLHQLLESDERGLSRRIREILLGRYFLPYLPTLISSDVDADRADFIRRDAHQTGVAYGRYDLNWLISTVSVGRLRSDTGAIVVGFDYRKAMRVVEQFLIARRAMYDTVYHHKTVRCAESMVALFLKRLRIVVASGRKIEAADFLEPMMRVVGGGTLAPHELSRIDDFALFVLIETIAQQQNIDPTVQSLAQRLSARDLFKVVRVPSEVVADYLQTDNARSRLYDAIRPFCTPCDPEYFLAEDVAKFDMISSDLSKRPYFITDEGEAVPATEHVTFQQYTSERVRTTRLYTLDEARPAVERCIQGTRAA